MNELSDETRDLLAIGREGVPVAPDRRAAIRAGMVAKMGLATAGAIGATTAGAKTASAAGIAAGWGASFKVVGIAVVAVAVGGGTLAVVKHGDHRALVTSTSASNGVSRNGIPSPAQNAGPSPAENLAAEPGVSASAEVEMPPVPLTIALAAGSGRVAAMAPSTRGSARRAEPATVVEAAPATTEKAAAAPSSSSSLESEALLLQDAHRALSAGNGEKTLRLLDEHAARFPNSSLEPERSAERVFALCHVGRAVSAKAAADAFLAAHPDGLLATRVRGSCVKANE